MGWLDGGNLTGDDRARQRRERRYWTPQWGDWTVNVDEAESKRRKDDEGYDDACIYCFEAAKATTLSDCQIVVVMHGRRRCEVKLQVTVSPTLKTIGLYTCI